MTQVSEVKLPNDINAKKALRYFCISQKISILVAAKQLITKSQSHEQRYNNSVRNPKYF